MIKNKMYNLKISALKILNNYKEKKQELYSREVWQTTVIGQILILIMCHLIGRNEKK